MQCLNEDVLSPMVACIRKMPRLLATEALSHLWPEKAPAGTDLAGSIINNATLNTCRSGMCVYLISRCLLLSVVAVLALLLDQRTSRFSRLGHLLSMFDQA